MKIFYVVFPTEKHIQKALDAIRLLAEPDEKFKAHLTLRGPYNQRRTFDVKNKIVEGATISVNGVGRFFNSTQHTVYLKCTAPELRKVWRKPDIPEFNPHLTLYDDGSRQFASALYGTAKLLDVRFNFTASSLFPLRSERGQGDHSLLAEFDGDFVYEVTGQKYCPTALRSIPIKERLDIISSLLEYLNDRESSAVSDSSVSQVEMERA